MKKVFILLFLTSSLFLLVFMGNNLKIKTRASTTQPSLSEIILFDNKYSISKTSSDYVVMLFKYGKTLNIEQYFDQTKLSIARSCTGAIIGSNWILTAAHCVKGINAGDLGVLVGFYDLKKQKIDNSKTFYIRPLPTDIYIHKNFSVSYLNDGKVMATNDLALIKIRQKLPYYPVSLASEIDYSQIGIASGWGAIGKDKNGNYLFSDTLKQIELYLSRPSSSTLLTDSFYGTKFTDKVLASYVNDGFRINAGDSGSPLVIYDKTRKRVLLIGIDSSGVQFTNVTKHLNWIKDISGIVPAL